MRLAFLLSCFLTLCATAPSDAAPGAATSWPAGRTGMFAKRWVDAFAAGEDSMRAFLTTDMAAASLAERNVAARIERYREMHDSYGRFQLEQVVKSEARVLTVKLLDAQAKSYDAVFTLEPQPPFKLKSVTLRTRTAGGHSLFGGFHH